ncbi:uncharacterized protein CDV56_106190 [Aspergillus thermomutatus]|uniref:Alcohol dehydrogenase-like N-terminal domain-containing protein n=1 Tax=Aspergillus thermomutatus TaxID=41047 RepID=A0A397H9S1_ASPTH|nr:uncharacterized protein CDV56_106190 [Aspergillus thermomutatus]RHZ59802.1 hypothetical protein CDV56_106190 [Aspergillus thermomutatus]
MARGSNTALVVRVADGESQKLCKEDIPIPCPTANQVLVKISHVAQNPTDVQSFDRNAFGDGAVLGCDFVGEVVELGSHVTRFARGDLVAGLIWGGLRYQLAGLGRQLPRHADLVRSYGAKHVFDYNDQGPHLVQHRLARPHGGVGNLCTVRPGKANTKGVAAGTHVTNVLVWTAFLKDHSYGEFKWPASKDDHELASELFENLPSWLEEGTIRPNSAKLRLGLDAVSEGFQEYRDGKISAYKLVYEL